MKPGSLQKLLDTRTAAVMAKLGDMPSGPPLYVVEAAIKEQLEVMFRNGAADAWMDLMQKFSERSRFHTANLLGHEWHISAIEISCDWAKTSRIEKEPS